MFLVALDYFYERYAEKKIFMSSKKNPHTRNANKKKQKIIPRARMGYDSEAMSPLIVLVKSN